MVDKVRHLRCNKLQLLETNGVAVLGSVHFLPLDIQQSLEGEDELKVGGGRDIVVSPQCGEVPLRHLSDTCLEGLAHFHNPVIRENITTN